MYQVWKFNWQLYSIFYSCVCECCGVCIDETIYQDFVYRLCWYMETMNPSDQKSWLQNLVQNSQFLELSRKNEIIEEIRSCNQFL